MDPAPREIKMCTSYIMYIDETHPNPSDAYTERRNWDKGAKEAPALLRSSTVEACLFLPFPMV
jgi:hypothetical protein